MSLQVVTPSTSPSKPKGRVDILDVVPIDVAEDFLELYRAAFEPLVTRSPARQWLTDEEFRHDMSDPSVLKFVGRSIQDEIVALAFMSTDLSTVPWISEPYFAHRYPEHYARGHVFYFGAMLVRPDRQGGPWAKYLLDHLFHYVAERRGIGCFDCCSFNVDTVALPELISRAGMRIARFDMELLDQQAYYATIVDGFK
jgi:GNAT superfamily N-acetyltransferase